MQDNHCLGSTLANIDAELQGLLQEVRPLVRMTHPDRGGVPLMGALDTKRTHGAAGYPAVVKLPKWTSGIKSIHADVVRWRGTRVKV